MTVDGFLNGLSDVEFEEKFLELAKTESFSAIASGVGTHDDRVEIRNAMIALELPIALYKDDLTVHVAVGMIAGRIMKKR